MRYSVKLKREFSDVQFCVCVGMCGLVFEFDFCTDRFFFSFCFLFEFCLYLLFILLLLLYHVCLCQYSMLTERNMTKRKKKNMKKTTLVQWLVYFDLTMSEWLLTVLACVWKTVCLHVCVCVCELTDTLTRNQHYIQWCIELFPFLLWKRNHTYVYKYTHELYMCRYWYLNLCYLWSLIPKSSCL